MGKKDKPIFKKDEMRLLAGLPLHVPSVGDIKQPKLIDIAEIGHEIYDNYLSILTFDLDDLQLDMPKEINGYKITTYDICVSNCMNNEDFKKRFLSGLSFFFQETVSFYDDFGFFYVGDLENKRYIHKDNYEYVKDIIKSVNFLKENSKKEEFNPASKGAQKIAENIKKAREKKAKLKGKDKEDQQINLTDIISAYCIFNKINDMTEFMERTTFYQFNLQFQRMQMYENYDISIRSLLAGADPKNVEIQPYTNKIV